MPLLTDPRDLLLGPDNDLVVTTDLQFTRGIQAVVQSCRIALQMFAGEWFLDQDAGMPYWQSILAQKPAAAKKAFAIAARSTLLAIDGVQEVTRLDVTHDRRKLTLRWQVRCVFGETPADTVALAIGGA